MAQASQFIQLTGQIFLWFNNIPLPTCTRVSIKLTKPINKQKSGSVVGIATGIPDPSGNLRFMTPADSSQAVNTLGLVLQDNPGTLVMQEGTARYQITGVVWGDASHDNDPGQASLENTIGFEGAIMKQTAT